MKVIKSKPAIGNQTDLRVLGRLHQARRFCLALVAVWALGTILAWVLPPLRAASPSFIFAMKANTAVALLLLGAGFWLLNGRFGRLGTALRFACVAVVLAVAIGALIAHARGQVSFVETILAAASDGPTPGLMAIQTAIALTLAALILALEGWSRPITERIGNFLTFTFFGLNVILLSALIFNTHTLYSQSATARTSPQTLVCLLVLGFVAFVGRAESGLFAGLVGQGVGSRRARLVWPFIVTLPFTVLAIGYVPYAFGWMAADGATAFALGVSVLLVFLVLLIQTRATNRLTEQLRELSLSDELTGLGNRRAFDVLGDQAWSFARRNGGSLSVVYFDLDGLKQVNDSLGHDSGSRLIATFAGLLRDNFRESDVAARIGGDEFALAVLGPIARLEPGLARLATATARLNESKTLPFRLSYSVGVASTEDTPAKNLAELVGKADAAMYGQKLAKKTARPKPSPIDR